MWPFSNKKKESKPAVTVAQAISIALFLAGALPQSQAAPVFHSRAEFAVAMAKVKEGMTEKQVLDILGKPDDVRTQFDPGGIGRVYTKEIWCYGAYAHLGFPTLGCVYIDQDGRSQESFGGKGQPPKAGLFKEDKLRDLLRLLDTAPGLDGYSYNPQPVIQIVNTLQPLGKEKALAAIGEYIRVSDRWRGLTGSENMFLVLRTLFDVPDNIDPSQVEGFGAPSPPGPKDPHRIPRFPIVLVDDIPLMLAGGYMLEGMPIPMDRVLAFFRDNGQIHPAPLTPTNDPLSAIVHLMNSKQWIYGDTNLQESGGFSFGSAEDGEREKSMLMEQLLRLIDSVYRMPTDVYGNRLPCGEPPEPTWQKIVSDVSALKIKWDTQQNMLVFQNGTHNPKLENKIFRRQIWKLTGLGFEDAELVLERKNESWLDVIVSSTQKEGARLRPGTLFLFENNDNTTPAETFSFTNQVGFGGGSTESRTIAFPAGSEVTAKLAIPGYLTNSSPVWKP